MGKSKVAKDTENSSDKTPTEKPAQAAGSSEEAHVLLETLQLQLDKILEAITASREALEQKIETVVVDMTILHADQRKVAERVSIAETSLMGLQPVVSANNTRLESLQGRLAVMERRMEDLEGLDRRSNRRVIGLPEGAEGLNMLSYLETWLTGEVVGEDLSPLLCTREGT